MNIKRVVWCWLAQPSSRSSSSAHLEHQPGRSCCTADASGHYWVTNTPAITTVITLFCFLCRWDVQIRLQGTPSSLQSARIICLLHRSSTSARRRQLALTTQARSYSTQPLKNLAEKLLYILHNPHYPSFVSLYKQHKEELSTDTDPLHILQNKTKSTMKNPIQSLHKNSNLQQHGHKGKWTIWGV